MKKIFLLLLALNFIKAQDPTDLPNFTAQISIRNVYSGNMIILRNDRLNWKIRDVFSDEVKRIDRVGALFRLTPVQFVDTVRDNVCLAFSEGHLRPKTCFEDINNRQYETVFTIIPTSTTAVQLRLIIGGGDKCLTYSDNPDLPFGRPFELKKCNFDQNTQIDLKELFLILPPFTPSKVTNP